MNPNTESTTTAIKENREKPTLRSLKTFVLFHLIPLSAFWMNVTRFDWVVCICVYFIGMFFVTAGYHRYFSHRSYKTSRVFQFILAFMAATTCQKGALWWASHHRHHHRYSDQPQDAHSAKLYGFWYSHIGWIMGREYKKTQYDLIQDFAKYPELVWLNNHKLFAPIILATFLTALGGIVNGGSITCMFTDGLSTLVIGFFLGITLLFHGTFSINSLMHKIGRPRYKTNDESKNSLILALVTLGEGWHNNHHFYMSSARQGFYWWEIDITYYILKFLSLFGIVWDIKVPPQHILTSRSHEEAKQKALEAIQKVTSPQEVWKKV